MKWHLFSFATLANPTLKGECNMIPVYQLSATVCICDTQILDKVSEQQCIVSCHLLCLQGSAKGTQLLINFYTSKLGLKSCCKNPLIVISIHSWECTLLSIRGTGCFALPQANFHAVEFMHFLLILLRPVWMFRQRGVLSAEKCSSSVCVKRSDLSSSPLSKVICRLC